MDKVLIYCLIAPKTPKIYGKTLQGIFRLEWPHQTHIIFDREDNPTGTKYQNICEKHNRARNIVLQDGWDAVLFVENDMILPPDTLMKLAALPCDVAYGLYCSRHGHFSWLAFAQIHDLGGLAYSQSKELMKMAWGNQIETEGVGMGCTLIRRKVLEEIQFRTHPEDFVADDWLFAVDCKKSFFTQMHDFSVVCGHIRDDQTVLWPDPTAHKGYKIEFPENTPMRRITPEAPLQINVGYETKVIHGIQSE